MSDQDNSKVQSEAERKEHDRFELSRKGQAKDAGIIATNAAPADDFSLQNKDDKKRDDFVNLVQMLATWQATMDDLQARMQAVLDKATQSLQRISHMQELQQNWDFQQAQAFYSETYSQDISRMDEVAARQLLMKTMDRETMDYTTYIIEAGKIERQMRAHFEDPAFLAALPEQQQDFRERYHENSLNQMTELNTKAGDLGINIEEAGSRLREQNGWNSQLYQNAHNEIVIDEYQSLTDSALRTTSLADDIEKSPFDQLSGLLTDTFEAAAKGETIEQLSTTNDIPPSKVSMKLGGS